MRERRPNLFNQLEFRKNWFTAVAFEPALIVGNEETAQWYERWIDEHAQAFLEDMLTKARRTDPNSVSSALPLLGPEELEIIERDLTFELVQMVIHYKGIAASRVVKVIGLRAAPETIGEIGANLNDAQRRLLNLLSTHAQSEGAKEFHLTQDDIGLGVTYVGGPSVRLNCDFSDFEQLRADKLITLNFSSRNVWLGKLTHLGPLLHVRLILPRRARSRQQAIAAKKRLFRRRLFNQRTSFPSAADSWTPF